MTRSRTLPRCHRWNAWVSPRTLRQRFPFSLVPTAVGSTGRPFVPMAAVSKTNNYQPQSNLEIKFMRSIKKRGQTIAWFVFPTPQERTSVLNQSRLFKRGEHLLAVGLEFQFLRERLPSAASPDHHSLFQRTSRLPHRRGGDTAPYHSHPMVQQRALR